MITVIQYVLKGKSPNKAFFKRLPLQTWPFHIAAFAQLLEPVPWSL